ncbi:MAG: ABC transporter ATP-binding protein [Clostridia bacterium]
MNALELKDVSKHYGSFSLDNVSFVLPSGCIMGLVGENGAGKSTTIRLIMRAALPDSGTIMVLGQNNTAPTFRAVKEDIGIVLDEAYFPEVITVKQVNIIMKNTYKRWDEAIFSGYIKQFDLPLDKAFKAFSRGMKMKLAIAVALSHAPKLLILDEATSGQDPIMRDEILEIFSDFTRDEQHSILISSHILSDLEKLCDYIAFLHKGQLLFCSEKDRLMEEYGMLNITRAQFEAIPSSAVCGCESSEYGVRCLVKRRDISSAFNVERASIEDIILFLAKGGRTK